MQEVLTQADHHTETHKNPIPEINEPIDDDNSYKSPTKPHPTKINITSPNPDSPPKTNPAKNSSKNSNTIVKAKSGKVRTELRVSKGNNGNP